MADRCLSTIREFLAQKRIAIVGVNRNPRNTGAALFREFRARGYDVVPVNANADDVEGARCWRRVQDVKPPPDAAIILVPQAAVVGAVDDCIASGIRRVWIWGLKGSRGVSPNAVARCQENGVSLVPGYCPFMFLPDTQWFHRAHGWVARITGGYPA